MSTTYSRPASAAFAGSEAFRAFAVVCAISAPIVYTVCEMNNWPLFTYHPGTNRVDWGFAAAVRDQGPAMHWYGWTATTLLVSFGLGLFAAMLPRGVTRRIPLFLTWFVPIAMIPVLVYALRFFWRW